MAIQARWRLAELDLSEDDPFDTVILSSGLRIDLSGDEVTIHEGLGQTLRLESRLYNKGITCGLKDGGQDCRTCHLFTAEASEVRAPLCALGRDQSALEGRAGELAQQRHAPHKRFGARMESYGRIAERFETHPTVC